MKLYNVAKYIVVGTNEKNKLDNWNQFDVISIDKVLEIVNKLDIS